MTSVELEIPARSAYVGVVRLALASLARGAGLDEEKIDDLKIAVSEACATAVLLNEQDDPPAPIGIRWNDDGERVMVEVSDHGSRPVQPIEPGDSLSFSSRAMMSEALLRTLVDEYQSIPHEQGGTTTRLLITR